MDFPEGLMARTAMTNGSLETMDEAVVMLPTSVDPASAQNLLAGARLGERIKKLRLKRSMGLVELGQRTGLSASFLSQLETGRVVPTLRNLSRIALVFGKDLNYFFEGYRQGCFRVSRGNFRSRLTTEERAGSMISESMSVLIPDRSLVPCIAEFPLSDSDAAFLPKTFEGEE